MTMERVGEDLYITGTEYSKIPVYSDKGHLKNVRMENVTVNGSVKVISPIKNTLYINKSHLNELLIGTSVNKIIGGGEGTEIGNLHFLKEDGVINKANFRDAKILNIVSEGLIKELKISSSKIRKLDSYSKKITITDGSLIGTFQPEAEILDIRDSKIKKYNSGGSDIGLVNFENVGIKEAPPDSGKIKKAVLAGDTKIPKSLSKGIEQEIPLKKKNSSYFYK